MDNILINLSASAEGLQPGIDGLVQIEVVDRRVADQAKKTMAAYQQRDKAVAQGAADNAASVDKLARSFQNLDKSIVGGAYTKVLKDLQNELGRTTADFDKLSNVVRNAEQQLASVKPNSKEYKALADTIRQANTALDALIKDGIAQEQAYSAKVETEAKRRKKAREDEAKAPTESKAPGAIQVLQTSISDKKASIVGEADVQKIAAVNREVQNLEKELKALQNAGKDGFDEFGNELEVEVTPRVRTLKGELKALKEQLAQMETAGQEGSAAFEALQIKAAHLEDQIGDTAQRVRVLASDSFKFDAALGAISGVTAGFSILQGVIALTGNEDENLQKALLKVNAAMAVLQGLQQLQNLLQKQSVVMIALETLQRRAGVAATNLQAAAESKNIIVRYAAIIAQRALNAAMNANPIVLLVTAIAAAAGALAFFSSNTDKATDSTKEFNEALLEQAQRAREVEDLLNSTYGTQIRDTEVALSNAKARGASTKTILDLEHRLLEQRQLLAQQKFFETGGAAGLDELEKKLSLLKIKLDDFGPNLSEDDKKLKDGLLSQYNYVRYSYEQQKKIVNDYYTGNEALRVKDGERVKLANEQALKSATAYAEALVLRSKEGTRDELNAKIEALHVAQREQLANINLTEGERAKIKANTDRQISDLNFAFEKRALESAKAGIDAQVLQAQEGTREELDLKLAALAAARDVELKDKTLTKGRKLAIDAEYYRGIAELMKAHNEKITEDALNARIAEANSQIADLTIARAEESNADLLAAKERLVDNQAALEVLGVQKSVDTEENKRVRIKAIYDKALIDKNALEDAKVKAEIDAALAQSQSVINFELAKQKRIQDSEKATAKQKDDAQQASFDLQQDLISAEYLANQRAFESGALSYEAYLQKKRELQTQYDDLDAAREQAHQAKLNSIRDFAFSTAGQLVSVFQGISQKGYEDEQQKVQDLYDRKRISEVEYQNRMKVLKKKQAEDDKAMAVFQTLIQQGPTVLKGFQQGGFAGIAAAFTLFFTLLSSVTGTKVPAFKDGVVGLEGPGTGTSDSIHARLSRGETVTTAAQTQKHRAALQAIHDDRFHDYLAHIELPKLYANMRMAPVPQIAAASATQAEPLDYGRLAEAFAEKLAENPHVHVSMDERGFTWSVQKGLDTETFKNKKIEN